MGGERKERARRKGTAGEREERKGREEAAAVEAERQEGMGEERKKKEEADRLKREEEKIEITANLIHWQVEQNEKIAISSIDKTSVFSAQDIAENKARKIEKEKKKTGELFKMEEKKKEREKAAVT